MRSWRTGTAIRSTTGLRIVVVVVGVRFVRMLLVKGRDVDGNTAGILTTHNFR